MHLVACACVVKYCHCSQKRCLCPVAGVGRRVLQAVSHALGSGDTSAPDRRHTLCGQCRRPFSRHHTLAYAGRDSSDRGHAWLHTYTRPEGYSFLQYTYTVTSKVHRAPFLRTHIPCTLRVTRMGPAVCHVNASPSCAASSAAMSGCPQHLCAGSLVSGPMLRPRRTLLSARAPRLGATRRQARSACDAANGGSQSARGSP